jgi:D-glycero-D-manno-heptose 1,7-bisphosphate phosphatase
MKNKCVFFDRDGIVNVSPGEGKYVLSWNEFKLQKPFVESLEVVHKKGYKAAIVTNQRCVAKGLITIRELETIHQNLIKTLKTHYQLSLLDIAYCPHNDGECSCRKPLPGMLLSVAQKYDINLKSSWMIGDSEIDVQAGMAAGTNTILITTKKLDVSPTCLISAIDELPELLENVL